MLQRSKRVKLLITEGSSIESTFLQFFERKNGSLKAQSLGEDRYSRRGVEMIDIKQVS